MYVCVYICIKIFLFLFFFYLLCITNGKHIHGCVMSCTYGEFYCTVLAAAVVMIHTVFKEKR